MVRIFLNLFPQVADVDIQRSGIVQKVRFPNFPHQQPPTEHLAGVAHKKGKKPAFLGSKPLCFAPSSKLAPCHIQDQASRF